jgi:hypothetical protein
VGGYCNVKVSTYFPPSIISIQYSFLKQGNLHNRGKGSRPRYPLYLLSGFHTIPSSQLSLHSCFPAFIPFLFTSFTPFLLPSFHSIPVSQLSLHSCFPNFMPSLLPSFYFISFSRFLNIPSTQLSLHRFFQAFTPPLLPNFHSTPSS